MFRRNTNLAFFAVAASGFGQTFFISIFGSALREEFALSNAHYGAIYSGATLASALAFSASAVSRRGSTAACG